MYNDNDKDNSKQNEQDKDKNKEEKKAWGYSSYDVDNPDEEKPTIIYTRHETSGRVNQYVNNNDGGHGHFSWKNADDYENDDENNNTTDYSRVESNNSPNPEPSEVEDRSGCYLTSACIAHYKDKFDDNCYELQALRWFRDTYVSKTDVKHYYEVAPIIVEEIENEKYGQLIFEKIYAGIIVPCVKDIKSKDYKSAYERYKKTILAFERKYCNRKQEELANNEIVNE